MAKTKKSPIEAFIALSDAQKDAAVADLDNGIDWSKTRPLNARERKQWQKTKRLLGRPKVGQGSKMIAVTVERGLLKRVDRYAKRHKLKRAQMIASGLEMLMRAG